MAVTTIFARGDMRRCRVIDLAGGEDSVMTGITALAVDLGWGVRKDRRDKAGGLVTHYAVFRRGYMGTGLADDGIAIVARDAVIGNTRVIKLGTGKGGGVMTG